MSLTNTSPSLTFSLLSSHILYISPDLRSISCISQSLYLHNLQKPLPDVSLSISQSSTLHNHRTPLSNTSPYLTFSLLSSHTLYISPDLRSISCISQSLYIQTHRTS